MMNKKVAFFLPPLGDGGVERTVLRLAGAFSKSHYEVDVITVKAQGPFLQKNHNGVELIDLDAPRTLKSLPRLVRYLRQNRPDVLISAQYYANVIAIWARFLARVSTRVIVTERLALSLVFRESRKCKDKFLSLLMRLSYPRADGIVAVSRGAAKDLARIIGVKEDAIQVIYNPTFDEEILEKANESLNHPWFEQKKVPIVLGAGRLTNQKDFSTLIKAFARAREEMEAKLIILGEGENRHELEELAKKLGVAEDVDMPGFVENPYKYMARADLFALSSIYEGMPNVIIEALAVCTPVIATDIPTGAEELLPQEALVPVGNDKKMAEKIVELLSNREKMEGLLKVERKGLTHFRPEISLQKYMELIEKKNQGVGYERIALFAPYLGHIGTEKVMLNLAKGFAQKGRKIHLIRAYREWPDFQDAADKIDIVDVNARHLINLFPKVPPYRVWLVLLTLELLPKLIFYLRRNKVDVLISGLLGGIAVLGRELGNNKTKVILSIQGLPRVSGIRKLFWKWIYPRADMIVTPCQSLASEVEKLTGIPKEKIKVIPNPVIDDKVLQKAKEPLSHPWFQKGQPPVIIGVGRLTRQKDFPTLLRAFACVRREMNARLVILGEGEDRDKLQDLAKELDVIGDIDLPGFVDNPYSYMARATLFVLSSRWEGPGHVLIEALALGSPVISTDCPSGPREILLDGKCGVLVSLGDYQSMAAAILDLLRNPNKAKQLTEEGRKHIGDFQPERVVREYLTVITE